MGRRNTSPKRRQLSEREVRFCDYILTDGLSEEEAYAKIWSIPPSHNPSRVRSDARKVARRPVVRDYMEAMILDRQESKNLDEKFVTDMLKDIAVSKKGSSTSVRALELLGKHMGMFKDRIQVDDPGGRRATADRLFRLANEIYEGNDVESEINEFEQVETHVTLDDFDISEE